MLHIYQLAWFKIGWNTDDTDLVHHRRSLRKKQINYPTRIGTIDKPLVKNNFLVSGCRWIFKLGVRKYYLSDC